MLQPTDLVRFETTAFQTRSVMLSVSTNFREDISQSSLHIIITLCLGVAVAAIPEGLPSVVTIALAHGVQKMVVLLILSTRARSAMNYDTFLFLNV